MSGFDSALSLVRQRENVFVIPVFQRPFAWQDEHICELLEDLDAMRRRKPPMHYLAPIHVAEIERTDVGRDRYARYVAADNSDMMALRDNHFRDDENTPLNVLTTRIHSPSPRIPWASDAPVLRELFQSTS